MANLITYSDFASYKDITANINDTKRLDPYIAESQNFDLRPLLNDELYFDFINNLVEDKYKDLLSGTTYTPDGYTTEIEFYGLKPVLVYFSYSRFLLNDNYKSTNAGFVVKKQFEYSSSLEEKTLARLASQSRASAMSYWKEAVLYLDSNYALYPLWANSRFYRIKKSSSGFNITAI